MRWAESGRGVSHLLTYSFVGGGGPRVDMRVQLVGVLFFSTICVLGIELESRKVLLWLEPYHLSSAMMLKMGPAEERMSTSLCQ